MYAIRTYRQYPTIFNETIQYRHIERYTITDLGIGNYRKYIVKQCC